MSCKSCDEPKPSRYEHQVNEEEARELNQPTSPPPPGAPNSTLEYMNTLSYKTLLSLREDAYSNEMASFFKAAAEMSEDFRCLQIHIMVQTINGEEYSPNGQTSIYCARLLKKMLEHDLFSGLADKRFPSLKGNLEAYLGAAAYLSV